MKITWYGQSCFKFKCNNLDIVIDPYDNSLGLKMPKLKADVVLITHDHFDHNNIKAISGNPFKINSPGEYEIKNVFIYGKTAFHDDKHGQERGSITMYVIEEEKLKIAHLSDLGQKKLTEEQLDFLDNVDVLLLPVGGKYTIGTSGAIDLINEIEPRIVIPMHYRIPGIKVDLDGVEKFVKELGLNPQKEDELKIIYSDLPSNELKLVILNKQ